MKSKFLVVCAMFVIALTAGCGGSSSDSGGGGGGTGSTASNASGAVASIVASSFTALSTSFSAEGGGGSMVVSKAGTLSDCTFYDGAGAVIASSTPDELLNALTNAYSYACEYDCSSAGTYEVTAQSVNDVPYFPA